VNKPQYTQERWQKELLRLGLPRTNFFPFDGGPPYRIGSLYEVATELARAVTTQMPRDADVVGQGVLLFYRYRLRVNGSLFTTSDEVIDWAYGMGDETCLYCFRDTPCPYNDA
jgi:hypothetical protein